MVITSAQLHSTKPELRFCVGSNPAHGVSEIRDGENLGQWSRLEIRLNVFHRSTISQTKQLELRAINNYVPLIIAIPSIEKPQNNDKIFLLII